MPSCRTLGELAEGTLDRYGGAEGVLCAESSPGGHRLQADDPSELHDVIADLASAVQAVLARVHSARHYGLDRRERGLLPIGTRKSLP